MIKKEINNLKRWSKVFVVMPPGYEGYDYFNNKIYRHYNYLYKIQEGRFNCILDNLPLIRLNTKNKWGDYDEYKQLPSLVFRTLKEAEQYVLKQKRNNYKKEIKKIKMEQKEALKFLKTFKKKINYINKRIRTIEKQLNHVS